jgi:hypothetical protein
MTRYAQVGGEGGLDQRNALDVPPAQSLKKNSTAYVISSTMSVGMHFSSRDHPYRR